MKYIACFEIECRRAAYRALIRAADAASDCRHSIHSLMYATPVIIQPV